MNDPKDQQTVTLEAQALIRKLIRQRPPGAELPPGISEMLTDRDSQNLADAAARRARRNAKRLARKG
jgi:hypothetical protein